MLIRFIIENVFSFGNRKEFNMFPYKRLKTLNNHRYKIQNFELLKMAAIYGANGAGKSNLVNALQLFQELVEEEEIPFKLKQAQFKFHSKEHNKKQTLAVEFLQDNIAFYYGIEILENIIITEELYQSGLGLEADKLIFERKTDNKGITSVTFLDDFENDTKSQVLKAVLLEELIKADKPIFKLIANRNNIFLKDVKKAYKWFEKTLQIITPNSKLRALAHKIDIDSNFKKYAEDMISSFGIGITSLRTDKTELRAFLGKDAKDNFDFLVEAVEKSPEKMIALRNHNNELFLSKENENIIVKQLKIGHSNENIKDILFDLEDESDGTIRLLDFVPAFKNVASQQKVYIIDEIERSIHPLLIKKLIKKFSLDIHTKGQLIFSTHESNLLDQKIFRQDEIWFAEKDRFGSTDLYPLSDFKEHKTTDIQKGYLNGRYGSIPFLSNLQDLNWY
ncbi:MAG: AAA family ATPase [Chitinophagales bacterium]